MLARMQDRPWLWACLSATALTTLAWLALPYRPGIGTPGWILLAGATIQFPGLMFIGLLAMLVPGGIHNHGGFLKVSPLVTWIFYSCFIRWLLSRKRSNQN